jgi:hypothetical protein
MNLRDSCRVACVLSFLIFSVHQAQTQTNPASIQEAGVSLPGATDVIRVLATFEAEDPTNGTFSFQNPTGEIFTLPLSALGRQQASSIKQGDQFWLVYNREAASEIRVERLQHQESSIDRLITKFGITSSAMAQQPTCSCRGGRRSTTFTSCTRAGGQCRGTCPLGSRCQEVSVAGVFGFNCGCAR